MNCSAIKSGPLTTAPKGNFDSSRGCFHNLKSRLPGPQRERKPDIKVNSPSFFPIHSLRGRILRPKLCRPAWQHPYEDAVFQKAQSPFHHHSKRRRQQADQPCLKAEERRLRRRRRLKRVLQTGEEGEAGLDEEEGVEVRVMAVVEAAAGMPLPSRNRRTRIRTRIRRAQHRRLSRL